jgi:hypothetical protein
MKRNSKTQRMIHSDTVTEEEKCSEIASPDPQVPYKNTDIGKRLLQTV